MKAYTGFELYYSFLTSPVDEVSGQFAILAAVPLGRAFDTHCVGCWVAPRLGVDTLEA